MWGRYVAAAGVFYPVASVLERYIARVGDPHRDEPRPTDPSTNNLVGLPLAFGNILDRAPVGYVEVDAAGVMVHANTAACVQLGIDAWRAEPQTFTQYLPPRSVYPFLRMLRELLATKLASSSELALRGADGATTWVRCDGVVLHEDTQAPTCLVSMVDISRRRAADARLRASEQRLRSLIESIPDGIFVVRQGRIVFSNVSAQRLVDCVRPQSLVGRKMQDLVVEPDRERLASCLEVGERPGPAMEPVELRFQGRGGRRLLVEATWMSMVFEETSCLLCVVRDQTERKEMQAQLAQADRLTTAGVLAAGVAHEINNPLTYIFLNLEHITGAVEAAAGGHSLDQEAVRESAARAMVGAQRVRDIVKDLKACTRDDDAIEVVSVDEVIGKALEIAGPQLRYRASVETRYGSPPAVAANPGRLSQVFLNLIMNAAQALGGVREPSECIRISTVLEGDDVVVRVQDNGTGIAESVRARLFEPFFTTKPIGEGSGLGLYICHQHLGRYGGRIYIDDDPAFRTTFVVRLPRHATDASAVTGGEPTAAVGPKAKPTTRARSLLVIDDDGIIRNGLTTVLLPRFGHVEPAASGNEAIELLRRGVRFDLILCDVLMGEGSGPELHRWLETYRPDMLGRIAFITGGAYTDDARRFFAERDLPCLEKPFTHDELAAFVDGLVSRQLDNGLRADATGTPIAAGVVDPSAGRWDAAGPRRAFGG
ncbi:MAG: PAS domain S-box protein [Myxococcales bacterium FL481]|nr:MAG: PAS domain S-box protein [Myxococcales bacterium FL481]